MWKLSTTLVFQIGDTAMLLLIFKKKSKYIVVMKIWIHTNPFTSIKNFSILNFFFSWLWLAWYDQAGVWILRRAKAYQMTPSLGYNRLEQMFGMQYLLIQIVIVYQEYILYSSAKVMLPSPSSASKEKVLSAFGRLLLSHLYFSISY